MAGRPQRKLAADIIKANLELVEAELSKGTTQTRIAEMLGISQPTFSWWATSAEGAPIYSRARARAAHQLTEGGLELAEELLRKPMVDPETGERIPGRYREPTTNEIQATKLVNDTRFKMAAIWNRAEFGEQRGNAVHVQVNVGAAALDSLRKTQVVDMGQAQVVEPSEPAEPGRLEDLL